LPRGRTNLFEVVPIVGKKRVFQKNPGGGTLLLVLSMMKRREEISAPLTRSPRFCGVQLPKGGGKQRVLLHRIEEAREPLKVVDEGQGQGRRRRGSWASVNSKIRGGS
jgi:hypothetical protein